MCASKCVTDPGVYSQPSFRHLSSWASLSFATATLMACQLCHTCPDAYCKCTHAQKPRQNIKRRDVPVNEVGLWTWQFTRMQVRRQQRRFWQRKSALTSAAVLIPALKLPLHFACSPLRNTLGIAECINYICTAIDPLSNTADCLHPPHVKPNCNC